MRLGARADALVHHQIVQVECGQGGGPKADRMRGRCSQALKAGEAVERIRWHTRDLVVAQYAARLARMNAVVKDKAERTCERPCGTESVVKEQEQRYELESSSRELQVGR